MATMFYDKDADIELIRRGKVAVIGYGSQGHAHALNLKDSGVDVVVGLPAASKSAEKATAAGLRVHERRRGVEVGRRHHGPDPRQHQAKVYKADIEPHLTAGKMLMFAHGFNIRFNWIVPPTDVDVTMVAPKAPGHRVREVFNEGGGTPGLLAVHQDVTGQGRAHGAGLRAAASAAPAPASSRRRSRRRPRPTSSASRPCSAAAPARW